MSENRQELLELCINNSLVKAYVIAINQTRNPEFMENLKELVQRFKKAAGRLKETVFYLISGLVCLVFENFVEDKYCVIKGGYLRRLYDFIVGTPNLLHDLLRFNLEVF